MPVFAVQPSYSESDANTSQKRVELVNKAMLLGWYPPGKPPDLSVFDSQNRWASKYHGAVLDLAQLGVTPESVVYIAAQNLDRNPFASKSAPAVCKADGRLAAKRISEGSHRLATDEEAEREKADDAARSVMCAELQRNYPEERKAAAAGAAAAAAASAPHVVYVTREEAERQGLITPEAPKLKPAGDGKSAAAVLQGKADERAKG